MEIPTTRNRRILTLKLLKIIATKFIKPLLNWYLKNPNKYNHDGFKLIINPGVFHPGFFFSTKYFYSFIKKLTLTKQKALEIGSGSGLLSLLLCKKKCIVTAIDVCELATQNTKLNFELNKNCLTSNFKIITSNLFENLQNNIYDLIIINPPYFFKAPINDAEKAWYCGNNGEYFEQLFYQLPLHIHSSTSIYIILADNCDIEKITAIAQKYNCTFTLRESKKIFWEVNYIYALNY